MTLIEQLVEIYKKALTKVFADEADKTKKTPLLSQTIFGCKFRAWIGITYSDMLSKKERVKLLALGIAKHRQEEHQENRVNEIKTLSRSLNMTAKEVGSADFWN